MLAIQAPLRRRRLSVAATITGCVLALSACGTAGSKSSHSGGRSTGFLAFSECMRSNGVPNFPDPSPGGGIHVAVDSINPSSPSVKTAQARCHKLLPGGGPPQGVTEQQKEQLVRIAECMRSHGVSGFPDPTTTPPTNPRDYSSVEGIGGLSGGLFLLVPKTIDVNSPAFKQAAQTCGFH